MVLTPAQRALAYAKRDEGGVASQLIKEKKFKELVDRIFETGDFDLFKAEVTDAQKRFAASWTCLNVKTNPFYF